MSSKKGLVGKDMKASAVKPGMGKTPPPGKPIPGGAKFPAKELPSKGGPARNLLSVDDVADRLRVDAGHVEHWLRQGWLRGSATSGIQLYELEKFRAKHHSDVQAAQSSAPPATARPAARDSSARQPARPARSPKPQESPRDKPAGASPLTVIKGAFALFGSLFQRSKQDKLAPYSEPVPEEARPILSDAANTTARLPADTVRALRNQASYEAAGPASGELTAPPAPSSEVWPSLEQFPENPGVAAQVPDWLRADPPAVQETSVMRAEDILGAVKHAVAPSKPSDDKQRNQELLQQLQEQRKAELELQDELETLRQRVELSLTSERDVRSQLKRARQELQVALEELEQRPPQATEGDSAPDELRDRCALLEAERASLEQQKSLLEQQLERVRAQGEEYRQHGLQWHALAVQADRDLKQLRESVGGVDSALDDARAALAASERDRQALSARVAELERQASQRVGAPPDELRARERTIAELQAQLETAGARWTQAQAQSRSQSQRWEQELQASASWVQKLTGAVSQRDKRISELEAQLSAAPAAAPGQSEEELKSQLMSMRVELNSLRRNYEIVSLQSKSLEQQLQQARRSGQAPPAVPPPPAAAPPPMQGLARDSSAEEEGAFRKRLNARLRSLSSPGAGPGGAGLESPAFLELDPNDS